MEGLNLRHVLLSEAVDLSLEIFVLKLGVVVAAQVGVVEGVVETGQRCFMWGLGTRDLKRVTGSIGSRCGGGLWRRGALLESPLGLRALLRGTAD